MYYKEVNAVSCSYTPGSRGSLKVRLVCIGAESGSRGKQSCIVVYVGAGVGGSAAATSLGEGVSSFAPVSDSTSPGGKSSSLSPAGPPNPPYYSSGPVNGQW